jgi:glyoxylase-like metal-dependent hydrolase (beta-lactamase superfamily II)
MRVDGYDIDILVTGYPGRSVCHGSLGWSTIVLVRHGDRAALVDVGSFGQRGLILERLSERGLKPADVTDLLLTHSHYDHALNWTLFRDARIVIGGAELDWSLEQPWGETPVPELYVRELDTWSTLHRAEDGETVFPGITAHAAPGHTPGHLVYLLEAASHDVIFTGDAAKNRAELLSRSADMTYDASVSRASIEQIWAHWQRRPGNVLVPGHDLPMVIEDGEPRYLGTREASVRAWLGEDLETTTLIELAVG